MISQINNKKKSPSIKERNSLQNYSQKSYYDHHANEFIYPIGFSDFKKIRQYQKSQYTIKDYHHILKLKKMLENTQKKMSNRINLFKKASQKIIKKRYQQSVWVQKVINVQNSKLEKRNIHLNLNINTNTNINRRSIQNENKENYFHQNKYSLQYSNSSKQKQKNHLLYNRINTYHNEKDRNIKQIKAGTNFQKNIPRSVKTYKNGRSFFFVQNKIANTNTQHFNHSIFKQKSIQKQIYKQRQRSQSPSDIHQIQQKIIETKTNNAKNMKEQKQKYKVIIAERKKQQINRNLQSAQYIRQARDNARITKLQIKKHKREQINKTIEDKIKRQKYQFFELEKNLDYLQNQERQALIKWKKTLDAC